jgi:SAM-dependent methyltransferase
MAEVIHGKVYDYPTYYDIIFAADWRKEIAFLEACFDKYASGTVQRVFEPACGTGRLLIKLAQAGYDVSGNDLNPKAIEFCNRRLGRRGFEPTAIVGDMADFRLPRKADAAFNLINSFRHLPDEDAATAHMQCIARALRKGGIYLLGLHLTPTNHRICDDECYAARRGNVGVESRLWTMSIDSKARVEMVGMTLDVTTPKRKLRLVDEMPFRMYTARQFRQLLARVPELELLETFDFDLDINAPIKVKGHSEDVIFVLRKT